MRLKKMHDILNEGERKDVESENVSNCFSSADADENTCKCLHFWFHFPVDCSHPTAPTSKFWYIYQYAKDHDRHLSLCSLVR